MTPVSSITVVQPPDLHKAGALSDLRDAVDRVLGSVFYGPLLQTMRSSSLKGAVGHGGRGEEIFQNQLDQLFAERAGQASNNGLGETLFNRFARAAVAHARTPENHDQPN